MTYFNMPTLCATGYSAPLHSFYRVSFRTKLEVELCVDVDMDMDIHHPDSMCIQLTEVEKASQTITVQLPPEQGHLISSSGEGANRSNHT